MRCVWNAFEARLSALVGGNDLGCPGRKGDFGSPTKEAFVLRTNAACACFTWLCKPCEGTTVHFVSVLRGYVSLGLNVFEVRLSCV